MQITRDSARNCVLGANTSGMNTPPCRWWPSFHARTARCSVGYEPVKASSFRSTRAREALPGHGAVGGAVAAVAGARRCTIAEGLAACS